MCRLVQWTTFVANTYTYYDYYGGNNTTWKKDDYNCTRNNKNNCISIIYIIRIGNINTVFITAITTIIDSIT